MAIYKETKDYKLIHDNMLNMANYIADGTIDCVITDPPYELGFMGKKWDGSGIAYNVDAWRKCFNALKDGGYLLAFGGTRTFHRIACAIEDAGFEIRETIMYLYGSGFPKSHNIGLAVDKLNGVESKVVDSGKSGVSSRAYQSEETTTAGEYNIKQAQNEWQGWGTALKPAYEPIIVARKPMKTSVAENVLKNRVGGINIDECRVGSLKEDIEKLNKAWDREWNTTYKDYAKNVGGNAGFDYSNARTENKGIIGRFPANIIHDGSDEVVSLFPNSGSGSASRFFYTAKASKKDRDEGLDAFEEKSPMEQTGRKEGSLGLEYVDEKGLLHQNPYAGTKSYKKNIHPTVKPTELMQYLVRLVAPKGATILDCFMGSNSTGKAVMFENHERNANYKFIGIELTDEYLPICEARIEYAINKYEYDEKLEQAKTSQLSIFDFEE